VTLLQKIDPEVQELIIKTESVLLSAGAVSEHADYLTRMLSRKLLKIDIAADNNISIQEILRMKISREAYHPHGSRMVPIVYRDMHMSSSDPHLALIRMVHKYVAHTDELNLEHSNVEEYLALISRYENYDEKVPCELLTVIMSEIFDNFRPGGYLVT
jgi:hypothetical protein